MLLLLGFLILGLSGVAIAGDGAYITFLKTGSALGALLGLIGIAVAGYFSGKSYDSYTGWERYTQVYPFFKFMLSRNHIKMLYPKQTES